MRRLDGLDRFQSLQRARVHVDRCSGTSGATRPLAAQRKRIAQPRARGLASAAAVRSLDAWLNQRSFVAAETFTMADIPAGTMMFRYFEMGVATPQTPAVAAWRGRLAERIPYRTHVMRPFGELFGRLAH